MAVLCPDAAPGRLVHGAAADGDLTGWPPHSGGNPHDPVQYDQNAGKCILDY